MKKLLTSFAAVALLALIGVETGQQVGNVTQAATRSAVKSYRFDRNKITQ